MRARARKQSLATGWLLYCLAAEFDMVSEACLEQRARAHDVVGAGAHDAAEAVHDARARHIPEQAVGVAEDVSGRVVVVELLRDA